MPSESEVTAATLDAKRRDGRSDTPSPENGDTKSSDGPPLVHGRDEDDADSRIESLSRPLTVEELRRQPEIQEWMPGEGKDKLVRYLSTMDRYRQNEFLRVSAAILRPQGGAPFEWREARADVTQRIVAEYGDEAAWIMNPKIVTDALERLPLARENPDFINWARSCAYEINQCTESARSAWVAIVRASEHSLQ